MKKTSVYLDDANAERLRRVAEAEGRSQAEIVRDAIVLYSYFSAKRGDRNFVSAASASGPGGSIADIPEDELLRGFGE